MDKPEVNSDESFPPRGHIDDAEPEGPDMEVPEELRPEVEGPNMKIFLAVLAVLITGGQLVVAIFNYRAAQQRHDTEMKAADSARKLNEVSIEAGNLRLVADKLPELRNANASELRSAFAQLGSQMSKVLPQSASADLIRRIISDATPNTREGNLELKNLQRSYVAMNVTPPNVIFIHYSQAAGRRCATSVAEQLKTQGVVARVEPASEQTGLTRLDYFNGDSAGASALAERLTSILGTAPLTNDEHLSNAKNYFGLWLNDCPSALTQ